MLFRSIERKKICLNVELSLGRDLRIHQDVVPDNGDIRVSEVVEEREVRVAFGSRFGRDVRNRLRDLGSDGRCRRGSSFVGVVTSRISGSFAAFTPSVVVVIVVVLMVMVSPPPSSEPSPSVIVSEAIGRSWSRTRSGARSRCVAGTSGGEAIGLLIGRVDRVWSDVLDRVDESLEGFRGHGYVREVDRLS